MSATFSTFCSDAIVDASMYDPAIQSPSGGKKLMCLAITTDTGDFLSIHFNDEQKFKEFCLKHNFKLEDKANAKQTN